MSRYINIDDVGLRKTIAVGGLSAKALWKRIRQQPSIDIVFCKECKRFGDEGWCFWRDVAIKPDDFCSYGQKGDENVETD